jgi:NADH-quinone oxidoreductase subunit G
MRVLPLDSEEVNECWISDRDRFGYEGLNSEERLLRPMVKRAGEWTETDWPDALEAAAHGLKDVVARHGAEALGVLLAPNLTLEELHLATKLGRGLGTDNIDHRVRQSDFRAKGAGVPWLGMSVTQLAKLESVLFVGSTLRKEQPVLSARVRGAAKKGLAVHVLHIAGDDLLMPVASRTIVKPSALAAKLREFDHAALQGKRSAIVLGHYAQQHPDYAAILAAAQELGRATGATVGVLPDGANAVGAHLVGAIPGKGLDARAMTATPRKSYLVAGVEADLDMGPAAAAAVAKAEFAVVLSAYRNATTENAHVMLPIAPYTETGGTFVNMEGRVQPFNGVVKPQGEARPAWKVLRMLGALLEIPGFSAESLQDVRRDIASDLQAWATQGIAKAGAGASANPAAGGSGIERIAEFGAYASDPIVRRSKSLQRTADGKATKAARMNAGTAASARLAAGDRVRVTQGGGEARLTVTVDAAVPDGCVRIARGVPETAALGEGAVSMEKVAVEAAA